MEKPRANDKWVRNPERNAGTSLMVISDQTKLEWLHAEIDQCFRCRSDRIPITKPLSMERGASHSQVMLVGLEPGRAASVAQRAFAGNSMTRLLRWFARAGYAMSEEQFRASAYLTSVNKCHSNISTAAQRKRLWKNCNRFFWRQLEYVRPKLVVLLGQEAAALGLGLASNFTDLIGRRYTTAEILGDDYFSDELSGIAWLVLPHPSGLSRVMNDETIASAAISGLTASLSHIGFEMN